MIFSWRLSQDSIEVCRARHPTRVDAKAAIFTAEHERRALVAFELPVQPSDGDARELAAAGAAVIAAVSNTALPCAKHRTAGACETIHVVLGIGKCDVGFIAADVGDRA